MRFLEVLMEVLSPRSEVVKKHEQQFKTNEEKMRRHLQSLEQTAIRGVTESTDEVAEYHYGPRT